MKVTHIIKEMAVTRSEGIASCIILGHKFYEHFHKIYLEGIYSNDFKHHCGEMQSWYDNVKSSVIKTNKHPISNEQLVDWFFTAGSSIEVLFGNDEAGDIYDELIGELICNKRNNKVVDVLTQLLSDNL